MLAFVYLGRERLRTAWSLALVAWFSIGGFGAAAERASLPQNHVTHVIRNISPESNEAFRWRGQLRSDPARLPWGRRFELDLEEVQLAGQAVPVTGGLRVTYYTPESAAETLPKFRAGDAAEFLVRARPPRNFQNPGAFDFRAHLARQDIHLTATLRSPELLQPLPPRPLHFRHWLASIRGNLLTRLESLFGADGDHAAVLRAMLLGDANFLDREISDAFQVTAVYHVLLISGMHVAALAAFWWWVGRRLRLPAAVLAAVVLGIVVGFALVVEDRPPVERATCMAAMVIFARLLFRRVEVLHSVAVAALLLLVARASNLFDPSFQLSFLAAGVIAGVALPLLSRSSEPMLRALEHVSDVTRDAAHSPRAAQFRLDLRSASAWLAERLRKPLAPRAELLLTLPARGAIRMFEIALVSFTVQWCLLPAMAHFFHRVSISGTAANLPAALLSGLIIPFGLLALAVEGVWSGLAQAIAEFVLFCTGWLLQSVGYFSTWRWSAFRVPAPPVWLLTLFLLALAILALVCVSRRARGWKPLAAFLILLASLCATHPFAAKLASGALEITVLDVGQGDSIFVAFPDGRTMLVDGGGAPGLARQGGVRLGMDVGEQVVSPFLWHRGLKRLDIVALSHAHQDHLEGLRAILENFRVGELWVGRDVALERFRSLLALAESRSVRVIHRRRGESFEFGGVSGKILWPQDSSSTESSSNNDSLVMRLEFAGHTFLLPGDIEKPVEETIVASGDPIGADYLKVPHHGSRTSASSKWLAAVAPRIAVMSLGEANPFGHPHGELLERLARTKSVVLRTDRDGAVTVLADQNGLRVFSFASMQAQ
jgi:competence protein ComEC